jgi:tRNA A-37 threonylcarbamoyl transferase component Bud32
MGGSLLPPTRKRCLGCHAISAPSGTCPSCPGTHFCAFCVRWSPHPITHCNTCNHCHYTESLKNRVVCTAYSQPPILDPAKVSGMQLVGEGRFSKVYRATYDGDWGQHAVAIKCSKSHSVNEVAQEAAAMFRVVHPSVLLLHGVVMLGTSPGLVTEFVDGRSAEAALRGGGMLLEARLNVLRRVAGAMKHCAGHGILHRDIAARNVMIDASGAVKLCDFGLARHLDETYVGTRPMPRAWTAPEGLLASRFDVETSDVWSFGVLMWEMLSQPYEPPTRERDDACTLRRPPLAGDALWALMRRCWAVREARPRFVEIEEVLKSVS